MTPQEDFYRVNETIKPPKLFPPPIVTMGDGGERDCVQPIITKIGAIKAQLAHSLQKVSERGETAANIGVKIRDLEKTSREFRLPRKWLYCCV